MAYTTEGRELFWDDRRFAPKDPFDEELGDLEQHFEMDRVVDDEVNIKRLRRGPSYLGSRHFIYKGFEGEMISGEDRHFILTSKGWGQLNFKLGGLATESSLNKLDIAILSYIDTLHPTMDNLLYALKGAKDIRKNSSEDEALVRARVEQFERAGYVYS